MKVATFALVAIAFLVAGWFLNEYLPPNLHLSSVGSYFNIKASVPPIDNKESSPPKGETSCAQVITPARNPATGDIQEFPTPCDIPKGWEVIENDVPSLDLQVQ